MLRLFAGQAEWLWDEALPVEVRELPGDLAALDRLLSDPGLLRPIVERFRQEVLESGRSVGVSNACGGGLGLDSLAAVLSDLAERAGAGRVDGPQADQAAGRGDGE